MTEIFVVSDFNAELVTRYLAADRSAPIASASSAPYGQVFQSLAGPLPSDGDCVSFVWTRPEGISALYADHLRSIPVSTQAVLDSVDAFAAAVNAVAARCRLVLVANWVPTRAGRGLGMLDWRTGGHADLLARMNLRLSEAVAKSRNVYVLNGQRWLDGARPAREPKLWYMMKCPFSESVCQAAARDVKAALRGALGLGRKLLLLDLDDTLWGGIVGDDGRQRLRLGGHDHVGEAYQDFQRALKMLSRRGIALGVISKNDEAVAMDAIDNHPEMVVRRSDLAGWRINWNDKARNIVDLATELNLGLQSIVYIDDNPAERGRVREALPEVLVPDWPKDPTLYVDALAQLDCFDQGAITAEDLSRTQMYVADRERKESAVSFASMNEWLRSLDVTVRVASIGSDNLKRAVQLLNKTNQMNLRTRRLTESELLSWIAERDRHGMVTLTVADRFGDLGLTGVLGWERNGDQLEIVDYVLSCRAMGRGVENVMVGLAVDTAREGGARRVVARLLPTERNNPCLEFWRTSSSFVESEPNVYVWDAGTAYPRPDYVTVRS